MVCAATEMDSSRTVFNPEDTLSVGASTLWDPWDASAPTLEIMQTKLDQVYSVPSNFCSWLSFFLVSALYNGWQMYIVKRTTKCKPTVEENHERGGSASTHRGAHCTYTDPLIGFERERVWKKWVEQDYSK